MANYKEDFAARLRKLRIQAGSPSFRHLAKITNYSSSTLADATSGRRLPTEPVLTALVTACGADPGPWVAELRRIAAIEQAGRSAGNSDTADLVEMGPSADAAPHAARRSHWLGQWEAIPKRLGRWGLVGLSAGALAVFGAGLAMGRGMAPAASPSYVIPPESGLALPSVPPFSGTPTPAPTALVADGTDPRLGHCEADKQFLDSVPVKRDGAQIG